jgi:S-adenosylmethionine/arginine decarboxylase-like enzyme
MNEATMRGRVEKNERLVIDLYGCDPAMLDDAGIVARHVLAAASAGGATVVSQSFHQQGTCGVSGMVVIGHRQCFVSRMPLYPGGYHVFFLYANDAHSYATPQRNHVGRHYTPEVHAACFALPAWLQDLVERQFAEPAARAA